MPSSPLFVAQAGQQLDVADPVSIAGPVCWQDRNQAETSGKGGATARPRRTGECEVNVVGPSGTASSRRLRET